MSLTNIRLLDRQDWAAELSSRVGISQNANVSSSTAAIPKNSIAKATESCSSHRSMRPPLFISGVNRRPSLCRRTAK